MTVAELIERLETIGLSPDDEVYLISSAAVRVERLVDLSKGPAGGAYTLGEPLTDPIR